MIATIHKSELHGEITICPSKSYEQRAWAIASLPNSEISITNCGKSADAVASHRIAQKLLSFDPNDKTFDCGESALCARMFPPIIALRTDSFILDGHGTLQKRNIRHDLEFFEKNFGWNISSKGLPINISNAHIKPGNYTIDGSHTSQVITGMIFALSTLPANSTITVENPSSTGYIFLTIEIARQAGADITTEQKSNTLEISIQGNTHYKASFNVEGDWSNAAFLIVAGLTNGEIGISGLNPLSQQPDRAIMDVLDICNANYEWKGNSLFVRKSKNGSFQFDATDTPDLIPPLCALALNADGECKIYGANRLIGKESNRLEAIVSGLGKLGASIKTDGNCIITQPLKNITPTLLDSHNDHRIAMMLAILGLSSDGIRIEGCECVEKSYPDFFEVLKHLGARMAFEVV